MTSSLPSNLSIVFNLVPTPTKSNLQVRIVFLLVLLAGWGFSVYTHGQISLTPGNLSYTQNFNTLANTGNSNTWTNNSTLPGWYAASKLTLAMCSTYRASDGTSSTAMLHSLGKRQTHSQTLDRALGSIPNDGETDDIAFGVLFENNSGSELQSVTVTFHAEQWRRVLQNPKANSKMGYQRTKVSWSVAEDVLVGASDLFNESVFFDIPEATLISIDTTTVTPSDSLNGNVIFRDVEVEFPVSIPAGWQFFLRFYDENASGLDVAIGVDDLTVLFSTQATTTRVEATSDCPVSAYLDMGIVKDIPDRDAIGVGYLIPDNDDVIYWEALLEHFYSENWNQVEALAPLYGYELAQFTEGQTSRVFFVLRKQSPAAYYWGTYVLSINGSRNDKLVMQAPHAIDDDYTGREAAAVFDFANARSIMFAGISRCINPAPGCSGTTKSCAESGTIPYRISDLTHAPVSIFQLATEVLATQAPETVFVQLHGFGSEDADFYVSCGTLNALDKNVPDYAVMVRDWLVNPPSGWNDLPGATDPGWDVLITHVDNNSTLGARDNIQGRFLNEHYQTCPMSEEEEDDDDDPLVVTNRFLHIEQFMDVRVRPMYYPKIAAALENAINNSAYVRSIPITADGYTYDQNFDGLSATAGSYLWGNNLRIQGLYAVGDYPGLFSRYTVGDGSTSVSGLYLFGSTNDLALGTLNAASDTGDPGSAQDDNSAYGVLFVNQTPVTITNVQLTYRAEQWRGVNGASQRVKLGYRVDNEIDLSPNGLLNNALFTAVPSGDMISKNDVQDGGLDGNADENVTQLSNINISVALEPDDEIFIRFLDEDVAGADKVIALDDLAITFSTQSVVPVNWLYFDVSESDGFPELRWGADNEGDCNHYQIERSVTGRDFHTITTLDCQQAPYDNQYEFVDREPPAAPRVYYRILQTDFDGEATYSPVRAFSRMNQQPEVYYLNGRLHVLGAPESQLQQITAVDFLGRSLCQGAPVNEGGNRFSMSCPAASTSLIVVKLDFTTGAYATLIRINNQ
jgi:hypothetical protein